MKKNIYSIIRISCSCNNVKIYTIYKKKQKKTQKNRIFFSNAFLKVKMRFFGPEMVATATVAKPVDLVVSFPWPRSTPQSEFPIKNYGCLKLRWSDFDFYFFYLFSTFSLSLRSLLSLFVSHLSFYM
jgi:hypothetical protein